MLYLIKKETALSYGISPTTVCVHPGKNKPSLAKSVCGKRAVSCISQDLYSLIKLYHIMVFSQFDNISILGETLLGNRLILSLKATGLAYLSCVFQISNASTKVLDSRHDCHLMPFHFSPLLNKKATPFCQASASTLSGTLTGGHSAPALENPEAESHWGYRQVRNAVLCPAVSLHCGCRGLLELPRRERALFAEIRSSWKPSVSLQQSSHYTFGNLDLNFDFAHQQPCDFGQSSQSLRALTFLSGK